MSGLTANPVFSPPQKSDRSASPVPPSAGKRKSTERWSLWRRSVKPEDIGVAVAPDYKHVPYTPMTTTTTRSGPRQTLRRDSTLLPEKPVLGQDPPNLIVTRPWSDVTHIDDGRTSFAESLWSDASCRTSLDWRDPQIFTAGSVQPRGTRIAGGGAEAVPRDFGAVPPARPAAARLPHEFNGHGLRTSKSTIDPAAWPVPPLHRKPILGRSNAQDRSQTPCNSMLRYSCASDTSFEQLDGDDDDAPLVSRSSKVARHETITHYPPVPRSLSGRGRNAKIPYHDDSFSQGRHQVALPPTSRVGWNVR